MTESRQVPLDLVLETITQEDGRQQKETTKVKQILPFKSLNQIT